MFCSRFLLTPVVYGLLMASSASALTLGRLQVNSSVGEPLRVEIEVTRFSDSELQGLSARLASPGSYQAEGMSFSTGLTGVTTRVDVREGNRPFIVLTGNSPVREAFVDLLLETRWSTGDAMKRYSVLLNDRNTAGNSPAPIPAPRYANSDLPSVNALAQPVSKESLGTYELNDKKIPVYRFDAPAVAGTAETARPVQVSAVPEPRDSSASLTLPAGTGELTVLAGQTASQLVMAHMPLGQAKLSQMLMALIKRNPQAFIEGNVNLIKSGARIHIPSIQEARDISSSQAAAQLSEHNERFTAYSDRIAQSPLAVKPLPSGREDSGKVLPASPRAAERSDAAQDQLTLAPGGTQALKQTETLARERQEKDAQVQIDALKKSLQQLEALSESPAQAPPVPQVRVESETLAQAEIKASAKPPEEASYTAAFLKKINSPVYMGIAGALVALLVVLTWLLLRRRDDEPHALDANSMSMNHMNPVSPSAPLMHDLNAMNTNAVDDTEMSKLKLATQLLTTGEVDLASALLKSVAASSSGDLQARAQRMLATIQ